MRLGKTAPPRRAGRRSRPCRVLSHRAARDDIRTAHRYYAERSRDAAGRMVESILDAIGGLAEFPLLGRAGVVPGTRERLLQRYPYKIIYQIQGETIEALRVSYRSTLALKRVRSVCLRRKPVGDLRSPGMYPSPVVGGARARYWSNQRRRRPSRRVGKRTRPHRPALPEGSVRRAGTASAPVGHAGPYKIRRTAPAPCSIRCGGPGRPRRRWTCRP